MKTLLIDNYDSYTYNLFHLLARINGEAPVVIKNDIPDFQLSDLDFYDNIVISPGPGHPGNEADFGICTTVLREAKLPILGVCLGQQGMATTFGGRVVHADVAIHGRRSAIHHLDCDVFYGLPQEFKVVRYHSLVVDRKSLPEALIATAWTSEGHIMGLHHRDRPIYGVQFHPESISTEYGKEMLENFYKLTRDHQGKENDLSPYRSEPKIDKEDHQGSKKETVQVHVKKLENWINPEDVFVYLYKDVPNAFWLDSSRAEKDMSRFSFMGTNDGPLSELIRYNISTGELEVEQNGETKPSHQSIFDYLTKGLQEWSVNVDLPFDFTTGFVGYFGYELKAENVGDKTHVAKTPDAYFIKADQMIAFDHEEGTLYLLKLTELDKQINVEQWFSEMKAILQTVPEASEIQNATTEPEFHLARNHAEYVSDIKRIQQEIIDGETYEITLTNEIRTELQVNGLELYRALRKTNPAPYSAYLKFGELEVLSSSPERFLKVDKERNVSAKPIKGTIKRGETEAEDKMLLGELKNSEKERAENLMIVDLLRNDLGVVCEIGTVAVPKLMDVESYETVHQLVSTVTGKLRHDISIPELVRLTYAGGSMTGAPKKRSMQIIDTVENRARGIYSGSIGFLSVNGTADLNIVIRTIVKLENQLTIGVGGAITMLSDAEDEYDEMLLKAEALIRTIRAYTTEPV